MNFDNTDTLWYELWNKANKVVVNTGVTSIGNYAFAGGGGGMAFTTCKIYGKNVEIG